MVPVISMVVGTVLTPTRVTDTVGMPTRFTAFLGPKAWVRRTASTTSTATPTTASSQRARRGVNQMPSAGESFSKMRFLIRLFDR